MCYRMISLVIPVVGLSACAMSQAPSLDEDFGAAVRHNIAVQTLNPDAGGPDDSTMLDGQSATRALESYREGQEPVSTESLIRDVGNN